ncbi:MAG: hypothetical protein Q8Q62_07840 [Mesorhizobium sp.]|nr:hypothetical protein [Mesorhizobium sp.]
MTFKTLATASIAFAMFAGSAFAQQAPAGTPPFTSADEQAMYESNREIMTGFFADETMTTLKSDEEVAATFSAMDAESQAGMKAACERAAENRGSYGTVTVALCDSVMKM